ncbi:MAG: 50S ribosomal protein L25 [Halobacteriovoraceae bacterium]|nr:50S ribosomal protein L25 [Halobacteriovoraceae bacterium]
MSAHILVYEQRPLGANKTETKNRITSGFIPGVFYGKMIDSVPIYINVRESDLHHLHRGSIFSVKVNSKDFIATCKEIQKDHMSKVTRHVSFMLAEANQIIETEVPLKFVGNALGEKAGGVVTQLVTELTILVAANKVPECIEIDISGLELNGHLYISDVSLPAGAKLGSRVDVEESIVSCRVPKVVEIPEAVAAEEAPAEATTEETKSEGEAPAAEEVKKAS